MVFLQVPSKSYEIFKSSMLILQLKCKDYTTRNLSFTVSPACFKNQYLKLVAIYARQVKLVCNIMLGTKSDKILRKSKSKMDHAVDY